VEDERFEIDMIIDSNMNTIRVLEPLAEEIAQLRGLETRGAHTAQEEGGAEGGNGTIKSPSSSSHINLSPRFTFQLDKRHLSTVNLNAISRIYGEAHGEEILELLRKNPVAAIPVILKRLRQKDVEWRAARVELNNGWKETVARNHFKSFDHRSFYFRQSDKKYLSTRHLVSEIVGVPVVGTVPAPVASSGVFGAAPLSSASAASEGENNSTVTTAAVSVELTNVGSAVPFSITTAAALSVATENGLGRSHEDNQIAGMGLRVEEENASLLVGMAPQLLLNYSNASHIVHRDIYKIMCHSAENTLNNSSDKERLAALWRDLLRVFFNVPPHYLYSQLVPSLGSSASSSSTVVGESLVVPVIVLDPSEAWLPSTRVLTLFGSGTIKAFRAADSMYEVALSFGTAFLNPNVIYGAEQLSKQALSAIGVTTDPDTGKDRIFNGLVHSEPVAASTSTSSKGKNTTTPEAVPTTVQDPCKLFFGTQMCYIFLRLHHTLYIRLSIAHQLASEASAHYREQVREGGPINQSPRFAASHNHTSLLSFMDAEDTEAHVVHHHGAHGAGLSAADRCNPVYDTFFGHLLGLIEGNIDNARFEDLCRDLLGNKAYVLYTLDKIIAQGIKHLQAMASDENVNKLVGLFVYHHHKGSSQQGQGNAGVDPTLYRNHVSHILSHTMEDVYRFQLMTPHAGISTGTSQVGIQHMGILNPNHLPSLGAVGVTFLPEGVSVAINNNLDDEEEDEEEEEAMDVSLGGPGLSPPILQRQMSNMSAKSSLLSPNGRSMSMSRDDGELKAPKAVLSDGEDSGSESERDEEEEDDEEGEAHLEGDDHQSDGNNGDDDQDGPPSPPKQLLYSPRASRQQFMSTSS
jgi:paired amphipathic helix protein Sin3a